MVIGPLSAQALIQLNKNKTTAKSVKTFAVDIRNCRMIGFKDRYPDIANTEHPLLSINKLVPIRSLTLVGEKLRDGHLDLLLEKHTMLEFLDLSYNQFTTDGIIEFLKATNKSKAS